MFLSKNNINSVSKIPVANFCRLKLRKFILGMLGVWPPEISIMYVLWIHLFLKVQSASETVFFKLKAFNFTLKLLGLLSKQLA